MNPPLLGRYVGLLRYKLVYQGNLGAIFQASVNFNIHIVDKILC